LSDDDLDAGVSGQLAHLVPELEVPDVPGPEEHQPLVAELTLHDLLYVPQLFVRLVQQLVVLLPTLRLDELGLAAAAVSAQHQEARVLQVQHRHRWYKWVVF
jgi:hypothetical protein